MKLTRGISSMHQKGFSLMELMIGLTIGMISTIVIIQVMAFFETQRRTTTGSADAQTNGGIALYAIGRDVQLAGYPLQPVTDSALECTTVTYGATGISGITPLALGEGVASSGVNASDSITVHFGTTLTGGALSQITATSGNIMTVGSNLGCAVGDITMISSAGSCAMSTVTAVTAAAVTPVTITVATNTGGTSGANIGCMGSWNEITYAVDPTTGALNKTVKVNGSSVVTPVIENIVNIQAQYGVSATASSNQITAWVDPSGGTWAAPTLANRNRIKAVRMAVIARNPKIEPTTVSTACSSTTAAAPTGVCAWEGSVTSPAPTVDLSSADANWARYRYRVFETIIPLRNVIWAKDTL